MKKLFRMKKVKETFLQGLASLEAGETLDKEHLTLHPELQTAAWLMRQRDEFDPTPTFEETSPRRITARLQRDATRPLRRWQRRLDYMSLRLRPALTAALCVVFLYLFASIFQNTYSQVQIFLPGDILYPAKLFSERTQLLVNFDPIHEAQLHSDFARRRALEIEALILEEQFEILPDPVWDLRNHLTQAQHILSTLPATSQASQIQQELDAAVSSHRFILNLMGQKVPYYAKGSLEMAMSATTR